MACASCLSPETFDSVQRRILQLTAEAAGPTEAVYRAIEETGIPWRKAPRPWVKQWLLFALQLTKR